MPAARHLAVALIALLAAVALPAAAVAQSAGEDQYTDPLAGEGGGSGGGGSGGGGSGGGNAPAQPSPGAGSGTTPAPTQAAPAQTSDAGQLPRTGFPVALLLVSGSALLAGGIVLRRRTS